MAPIIVIWICILIGVNSCGVDSASIHYTLDCETDHQCPDGHYCFTPSHMCARCVECNVYKRTSSWRHCPKVPADCGKCLSGYEEEILAEGKTRDFCVASLHASIQPDLIHSAYKNVQTTFSAQYFVVIVLLVVLVPIIFYAFYWKKRTHSHPRRQHSSVQRDEPPPYRSIELTPVSSVVSDSVDEGEECGTLVMNISHTKDRVTEATPFRRPDYEEQENAYNTEEELSETEEDNVMSRINGGNLELEDETTMPSDWTPDRVFDNNNQMESEQVQVIESEDQECCQPSNKRRRKEPEDPGSSDSNTPQQQQQQQQQQQSINLFINNNIIIKKED